MNMKLLAAGQGRKRRKGFGLAAVLVLVILDQLTKLAAVSLQNKPDIILIPGVLQLHYLENQSAAFSMDPVSLLHKFFHFAAFDNDPQAFLKAKMTFFIIMTIAVVAVLLYIYMKSPIERRFLFANIILVFFMAGAIGNLIDRIVNNYVIDFIYFSLIDFPVFNVADIYVTCSSFALLYAFLFYYKEEEIEALWPFGKQDKKEKKEAKETKEAKEAKETKKENE